MSAYLMVVILVAQIRQNSSSGELANSYNTIISRFEDEIANAPRSKEIVARITTARDRDLEQLLRQAAALKNETLQHGDLIALSEAAERLKHYELAVTLAAAATTRAADIEGHVALVRCLCALRRVEDAERVVADAARQFPRAEKLYLLHNILAIKYRGLKKYDSASEHYKHVLSLVAEQAGQGPFFVAHFTRSMDELANIAEKLDRDPALVVPYDQLAAKIRTHLSSDLRRISSKEGFKPDQSDLESLRFRCETLLAISQRYDRSLTDSTLDTWYSGLIQCENVAEIESDWFAQFEILVRRTASSLGPGVNLPTVAERLRQAQLMLNGYMNSATDIGEMRRVADRLLKLSALLEQHQRHQGLVGGKLFSSEQLNQMKANAAPRLVLVQLINPADPSVQAGARALSRMRPQLDQANCKLVVIAAQTGFSWDSNRRVFSHSPGQGISDEALAIDRFRRMVKFPGPVGLLPSNSPANEKLRPTLFPINILLDNEGTVVAIVCGPEDTKIVRLLESAGLRQGNGTLGTVKSPQK